MATIQGKSCSIEIKVNNDPASRARLVDAMVQTTLLSQLDYLKTLRGETKDQLPEQVRPNSPDEIAIVFGPRAAALGAALLMLHNLSADRLAAALVELAHESTIALGWRVTSAEDARSPGAIWIYNASGDSAQLPLGPFVVNGDTHEMRGGPMAKLAALVWLDDRRMELMR